MKSLLNIIAIPLSWLYGCVLWVRHILYDDHILHSMRVAVPTICVGNLAVGGTGKTPMTEYLVRLLSPMYKVAVLSRGYGRSTRGFRLAGPADTAQTIGDEPMQIHTSFPDIPVAVCGDRVEGVKQLQRLCPDVQCVILDDAYQHRRIRCGFNILLTPYDRLYVNDYLLPRGLLRDLPSQSIRANVVVVTKCPKTMQPIERRIVSNALKLATYQQLFYSSIAYDNIAIAPKTLLVTGIANPTPLVEHVKSQCANVQLLTFPDHHSFSPKDIQRILDKAQYCDQILTTEKDYMRMQLTELIEQLGEKLKVIGMQTDLGTDQEAFNRAILLYVSENNRQQNK